MKWKTKFMFQTTNQLVIYRWDEPGDPETGSRGGFLDLRQMSMFIPNSSDVIDAWNFIHKKGKDWIGVS